MSTANLYKSALFLHRILHQICKGDEKARAAAAARAEEIALMKRGFTR
jgi:hypothetical protein